MELREQVIDYIAANPGAKFNDILCAVDLDWATEWRRLDRCLQKLRKTGEIEFKRGWVLAPGLTHDGDK